MPAEWDRHAATWLGWPHNPTDWPGKLGVIQWVYGEMVRKLAPGETVRLLVDSPAQEKLARRILQRAGADLERVQFHPWPACFPTARWRASTRWTWCWASAPSIA